MHSTPQRMKDLSMFDATTPAWDPWDGEVALERQSQWVPVPLTDLATEVEI